MKISETVIGLIVVSLFAILQGFAVESWVGRFLDFFMRRSAPRPRALHQLRATVKFVRWSFFAVGIVFIIFALLASTGFPRQPYR